MFTLVAAFGTNEDERGNKCLRWAGLPTLSEVERAVTAPEITAMRIETLLALPLERVNVYKQGNMEGSYDGEVLRVVCEFWGLQADNAAQAVSDLYRTLRAFYLNIVHGRVKGEFDTAPDA